MRYSEIVDYPRQWDKVRFPVLAHVEIDPAVLEQLERRVLDQTQVRLLGHDESDGGLLVVHVACADEAARRRFERRWTA